MTAFNKFNVFSENLAEKVHNLGSDTLKWLLTNTVPAAANTVIADLTEISAGNGYTAGGIAAGTPVSSAQTASLYKLVLPDAVLTASGAVGPMRYAVLYNATAAGGPLIGWYDYGSSFSLAAAETLTIDCDPTTGVVQISVA